MRKKVYSILLCVCLLISVCLVKEYNPMEGGNNLLDDTVTLHVWYTDEALTDYINSVALYYSEENDGVRVVPALTTGLEYLEQINESSINGEGICDVYIVSNDLLGKAYLSGLAAEIKDEENVISTDNFPKAALDAVTYQGKTVGCPFYYETAILLCNETYLDEMAQNAIQAEADLAEGEAAMEAVMSAETDEEREALAVSDNTVDEAVEAALVSDRKMQMIPSTMEELFTFADEYDAPENVESILKWDVSDIFFNYFFVGDAISVGGDAGDDIEAIDIYNQNAMEALKVYQELNQFFSIEADETTYESVLEEFIEGKTVFTIATTDSIEKIEQAKEEGKFSYEYTVAPLPDINNELKTRSLSVTYAAAVNGYSEHTLEASEFVKYLTCECDETLYKKAGKIPAAKNVTYTNQNVAKTTEEYAESVPVPKLLETSNFWLNLEAAFTNIWNGEDVESVLKALSEQY